MLHSWTRRLAASAATIAALVGAAPLSAQVGFPPTATPYRDLRVKYLFAVTYGLSGGGGGKVAAGPAHGTFLGARFDLHVGGPGDLSGGISYGRLDRRVLDPTAAPDERIVGTFTQSVLIVDAGIDLVLTGEKTWHGFAPYFGASAGMAFGGAIPQDSSGFGFRNKFTVGPQIGTRFHIGDRIFLRLEGRDMIWQLSYPQTYFTVPDAYPDASPILDATTNKTTQWTHNPMVVVSVGFALLR